MAFLGAEVWLFVASAASGRSASPTTDISKNSFLLKKTKKKSTSEKSKKNQKKGVHRQRLTFLKISFLYKN